MAKQKKAVVRAQRTIKKRVVKKPKATKKRARATKAGLRRPSAQLLRSVPKVTRAEKTFPGPGRKKPLGVREKRKFRDLLMRLRDHITGQITFLAADNLSRTPNDAEVDFRSEEQGTDNYERDLALNRVSVEQDAIFEIDEALNRIQIGTFGMCESCGRTIEKARLAALPYSRMCVKCQSEAESGVKVKEARPSGSAVFPDADRSAANVDEEEEE